jgi:hypothetical protein
VKERKRDLEFGSEFGWLVKEAYRAWYMAMNVMAMRYGKGWRVLLAIFLFSCLFGGRKGLLG